MYSKKDDLAWFRDVTLEIQTRALLESGLDKENIKMALEMLWSTRGQYNDDPDVNQLTIYQRKDRSRAGALAPGGDMPNVPLQTLAGSETDLKTYCKSLKNPELPLFLISGSVS